MINNSQIIQVQESGVVTKQLFLPNQYIDKPLSPILTSIESQMVRAQKCFPKIIDCDKTALLSAVKSVINKAIKDSRFTKDTEITDVIEMSLTVTDQLLRYFPYVTIPEIEIAVERGINGELGEFYGISAVSIYGFVRNYLDGEKNEQRLSAIRKQMKFEDEQEFLARNWEPTEQEQKTILFFGICGLINVVDNEDDALFTDPNSIYYSALKKLEILPDKISQQTQDKYWELAKQKLVLKKVESMRDINDSIKRQSIQSIIEAIKSGTATQELIAESRRLYMKSQLSKYVKEKTPKEVVNELKNKLLGDVSEDELNWEGIRMKLRKPVDLFESEQKYKEFLERTEELRTNNPQKP